MKEPRHRVFITGATGRLARALRSELRDTMEVVGISRQPTEGCLRYDEFLNVVRFHDTDAILHTAWSSLPLQAETKPDSFATDDLPLLQRITEAIGRDGAKPWFGFVSTCAVYGDSHGHPHDETDPPRPKGAYARHKRDAELLLQEWASSSGSALVILRLSNLYGFDYDPDKPQGVIARLLHCLKHDKPFVMWGEDTLKDYLHFSDACRAIRRLLCSRLTGVWNICSGHSASLREVGALASELTGKRLVVTNAPPVSDMSWDVMQTRVSRAKIASLGVPAPLRLEDGMRQLMVWSRRTE